ncbi:MAG: DUF177 domain-containing protein [Proteobacteria bacterium]|nr:DUF177 domain-containing protein [Pseudomonadota bacterium]
MIVRLHEIDEKLFRRSFRLSRRDFVKLEERFSFDWMDCEAELSKNQESIFLRGSYSVKLQSSCDFCLVPVAVDIDQKFDLNLIPEESRVDPEGDFEISVRSPDVEYYDGLEISLIRLFEDQLLLDMPLAIKCSEECKGICSVCGVNRNLESCECDDPSHNNPFSVLNDLKS